MKRTQKQRLKYFIMTPYEVYFKIILNWIGCNNLPSEDVKITATEIAALT